MATKDPRDRDLEGIIRAHFASELEGLRAPANLWYRLKGRLEEHRRTFWQRLFSASGGLPIGATAATAVMVTVVVFASVWFVLGDPVRLMDDPFAESDSDVRIMREEVGSGSTPLYQRLKDLTSRDSAPSESTAQTQAAVQTTTAAATTITTEAAPYPQATVAAAVQLAAAEAVPTTTQTTAATTTTAAAQSSSATTTQTAGGYVSGQPSDTTFRDYGRQPHVSTAVDAVSTFSLDADRTSYYLALGWAQAGYEVPPESVRAEEWVNAFDYRYGPPPNDSEFAIYSDVVGHPLDGGMHLARIAFQAPEIVDDRPLNVTLVLDASGSMSNGNRVAIAREAAEAIRQSLRPQDRIAVVHFTDDVIDYLTVAHARPDDDAVHHSIRALMPHSSTNVQAGLDLGVRLADQMRRERPNAYNYIILMSDGVANVDATDPFAILDSAHDGDAKNPLRLITIGVGIENYNDYLLEQLAQHGNGWYRYLDDTEQARATFARENWLALSTPFAGPDPGAGDVGP